MLTSYLRELFSFSPYIVMISLGVTALLARFRWKRPFFSEQACLCLTGLVYGLHLLCIWFFLPASGTGESAWAPGLILYTALRYGIVNTQGLFVQFLLNAAMLAPAGLFVAKAGGRYLLPALLLLVAVEGIQALAGRTFDADDLLAYLLGMLAGYSFSRLIAPKGRRWTHLAGLAAIALVLFAPFGCERRWEYGYVSIETTLPERMIFTATAGDAQTLPVYRRMAVDTAAVVGRLSGIAGIQGETQAVERGKVVIRAADGAQLQVNADGSWRIQWSMDEMASAMAGGYTEEELSEMAAQVLAEYGFYVQKPRHGTANADDTLYKLYYDVSQSQEDGTRLDGEVMVTLDAGGGLREMWSRVCSYEQAGLVHCLGAEAAGQALCSFPGSGLEPFYVLEAKIIYRESVSDARAAQGFLIPCWQFRGKSGEDEMELIANMIAY